MPKVEYYNEHYVHSVLDYKPPRQTAVAQARPDVDHAHGLSASRITHVFSGDHERRESPGGTAA
jgi:hypothetical protein